MIKWNAKVVAFGAALMFTMGSSSAPAHAEEVEKKFRLGLALGGYDTQSRIGSDAANNLFIIDNNEEVEDVIRDPRDDSAAIGELTINGMYRAAVTASYGFTRHFVVEGSIGYQKGDLGNVEMQFQSPQQEIPENQDFNMKIFRFRAGTITQVPIELTALARFRSKASLSPYIGGGVGYTLVGFEPSAELDRLSGNMDASSGGLAVLIGSRSSREFGPVASVRDLEGATVEARDTFAWHLDGGLEYAFKKKWSAFVDLRYVFAARALTLRFDGEKDFGRSVPDSVYRSDDPKVNDTYGAILVTEGGLIDAGRLEPKPTAPPETDCAQTPSSCTFTPVPDGQLDTGHYYVKGGTLKYGGVALQFGIKYTF